MTPPRIGARVTPWHTILRRLKNDAVNKRSIPFHVSEHDLQEVWKKQGGKCVYTGRKLLLPEHSQDYGTASVDRKDSLAAYTKDNIQFVHKTVNRMKWALSEPEFLAFCKEITTYASAR